MLTKTFQSIFFRLTGKAMPWKFYAYIISEISKPFLGAALFFLFVLMMFQVIRLADFFVVHNVSGYSILSLMSYLALTFTPVIIPIAFLLAVLLGFGRLSTDGEILAMRSAGMSVYSMLVPVGVVAGFVAIVTLVANLFFVPYGSRSFRYELFRISNTKAIATIHEGTFTEGFFDLVLYADSIDSKTNTLNRVMIYDERDGQVPVTVVARFGRLLNNHQDARGIPGLVLRLFEGSLHRSDPSKKLYELTEFDVYDIFLRMETAKVVGVEQPRTMDISTLLNLIGLRVNVLKRGEELSAIEKKELLDYRVELHKRLALPVTCLIFALMGVAFGVIRTRTVRSNSFLICLLVLLFYYGVFTLGTNLASEGKIPPALGIWAANVVLFVVAVVAMRKVAR